LPAASIRKKGNSIWQASSRVLRPPAWCPGLSSIEQTEVNEIDALSREDILGRIQALLQSDHTLLPQLVAMQAREVKDAPTNVTVVQRTKMVR
jgi:hypothetical protein